LRQPFALQRRTYAIIDRPNTVNKAVILARGLGKRMRRTEKSVQLGGGQREAADAGVKAMIPVGRPFLDFVLSALADSGIAEACIVIGPEHAAVREYYDSLSPRRIRISFAIQEQPLGTANAVLAARGFAADESFLVLNSDNYYPAEVFRALRMMGEPGVAAFERESLVRESNIPRDRVRDYALLHMSADGWLETIVEKPERLSDAGGEEMFVSMNCWRFETGIFRACEQVPKSARGEFELPQAVQLGITSLGMRFKAVPFRAGVLDLSYRSDVDSVAQRLAHVRPEL
jgi:glucose-1-phosphate thymidylyltransferase